MVKNQVMPSDVTNKKLLNAMVEIPREKFVPPENIAHAYNEMAIPAACEREIQCCNVDTWPIAAGYFAGVRVKNL